jgi:hypothetical protein
MLGSTVNGFFRGQKSAASMEKAGNHCNAADPSGRAFEGFWQGFRGCAAAPWQQQEKPCEDGLAPSYGGWRLPASLTQIKK